MHVAVLGAGTMGHGIAQVSAMAGHDVVIRDVDEAVLEDGLGAIERNLAEGVDRGKVTGDEQAAALARIDTTTSLVDAVAGADLVVEAIPERLALKQETLQEVENHVDPATVIGSNTSSLSVTAIAGALTHPERTVGIHFFNPVHVMDLVEIVVPEQAAASTVSFAHEYVADIEKSAVEVVDSPGFASSRLGVALGAEAMRMVDASVASVRDIDTTMEQGYNHPMGPLELTDVVGLDVRLDILEYLREELGERFRPPQVLKRKVRAGDLGRKTGRGFYVWEDGEAVRPADEATSGDSA